MAINKRVLLGVVAVGAFLTTLGVPGGGDSVELRERMDKLRAHQRELILQREKEREARRPRAPASSPAAASKQSTTAGSSLTTSTGTLRPNRVVHGTGSYNLAQPTGPTKSGYWSQNGQDRAIDTLLKGKRNGFFVEVGGFDGETFSNTLFFEKTRGWDGLLVEANPFNYETLASKDRNCNFVNACLAAKVQNLQFFAARDLTAAVDTVTDAHKNRVEDLIKENNEKGRDNWKPEKGVGKLVDVTCAPLKHFLSSVGHMHVDYFSLDVEGAEMFILQSLDWSVVEIDYFTIEIANDKVRKEIYEFMTEKGYERVPVEGIHLDEVYRRRGLNGDDEQEGDDSTVRAASAQELTPRRVVHGKGSYKLQHAEGPKKDGHWSQNGQDRAIDTLLKGKRNGFFVEVGGFDGETFSNTLFFEKTRGWDGLLVEANPFNYETLASKDRNCNFVNACLAAKVQNLQFFAARDLTAAVDTVTDAHKNRVEDLIKENNEKGRDNWKPEKGVGKLVDVTCAPLTRFLGQIKQKHVDYFSLDVEGAEMFILRSLDWPALEIDYFTIEIANDKVRKEIYEFMTEKGYERVPVEGIHLDEVYRRRGMSLAPLETQAPALVPPKVVHGTGSYKLQEVDGPKGDGFWSQNGQDKAIDNLLKRKRNGFFVEVGGFDGETHSNTLFLERSRGWDGLLVEANPYNYRELASKDRNCNFVNACISKSIEMLPFYAARELTAAVDHTTDAHRTRMTTTIKDNVAAGMANWKPEKGVGKMVNVTCAPLTQFLGQIKRKHVDYFSLDVEGAEMFILRSLDWSATTIDYFTIEVAPNEKVQQDIFNFMTAKGYERVELEGIHLDEVYRRRGIEAKAEEEPVLRPKQVVHGKGSYKLNNMEGPKKDGHWSQNGQDKAIDSLLKQKRNGFFVEVGGFDGETFSNTLFFEKTRGWDGLLVEANPFNYKDLASKGRNCHFVNACLAAKVQQLQFFAARDLTAAVDTATDAHKNRVEDLIKENVGKGRENWKAEGVGKMVNVTCGPLTHFLGQIKRKHVDYFSLDVEGAEMFILQSLDWPALEIDYFTIEIANDKVRKEIYEFMTEKGYERVPVEGIHLDEVYRRVGVEEQTGVPKLVPKKVVHGGGAYKLQHAEGPKKDGHWSQNGQDRAIDTLLKGKRNGFFVEVGGFDGETFSNTLFFEKTRGWDGLLVEANPYNYRELAGRDRNCHFVHGCLAQQVQMLTFYAARDLTAAVDTATDAHKNRVDDLIKENNEKGRENWKPEKGVGKMVNVTCAPFTHYMEQIKRKHVDYFSLDVEGAEMFILQSIEWDAVEIDYFTIEIANDKVRKEIYEFMTEKGYERVPVEGIHLDEVYRRRGLPEVDQVTPKPGLQLQPKKVVHGGGAYKLTHPEGPGKVGRWSQNGQDRAIDTLLKGKRNGFFVEVGGFDGETFSNTLFFEKTRGWDGLLVEANPFNYETLASKDRNCHFVNACLSKSVQVLPFFAARDLTAAVDTVTDAHKKRVEDLIKENNEKGRDNWKPEKGVGKLVNVTCGPLTHFLGQIKRKHVDYFSLDVEGAEMFILQSLDWPALEIDYFTIEIANDKVRKDIFNFMTEKGYERVPVEGIHLDEVYRRKAMQSIDVELRPKRVVHGKGSYKLQHAEGPKKDGHWSQNGQDRAIDTLLKGKRNGFFVEVGGFDGETFSNTLFFEKTRGWDGLLVEANPFNYETLASKDRNCNFVNACLAAKVQNLQFFAARDLTAAVDTVTDAHKNRVEDLIKENNEKGRDNWKPEKGVGKLVDVTCAPLTRFLGQIKQKHVDYFSLDVEGAEMFILRSLDWPALEIDYFTIEIANDKVRKEIYEFMTEKGYERVPVEGIHLDEVYRRKVIGA